MAFYIVVILLTALSNENALNDILICCTYIAVDLLIIVNFFHVTIDAVFLRKSFAAQLPKEMVLYNLR